ncbi:unnamed protein product [Blepharisma stoltei]|uniref:Uncharacterized protein n=1 Tax=Blepharisma stoltei TaxID=1481888 RepID=A0AAU9JTG2_9CILI|nr:unnamed protein product [Blepharisma stoltei]
MDSCLCAHTNCKKSPEWVCNHQEGTSFLCSDHLKSHMSDESQPHALSILQCLNPVTRSWILDYFIKEKQSLEQAKANLIKCLESKLTEAENTLASDLEILDSEITKIHNIQYEIMSAPEILPKDASPFVKLATLPKEDALQRLQELYKSFLQEAITRMISSYSWQSLEDFEKKCEKIKEEMNEVMEKKIDEIVKENEERIKNLKLESENLVEKMKVNFNEKLKEIENKHKNEIEEIKSNFQKEFETRLQTAQESYLKPYAIKNEDNEFRSLNSSQANDFEFDMGSEASTESWTISFNKFTGREWFPFPQFKIDFSKPAPIPIVSSNSISIFKHWTKELIIGKLESDSNKSIQLSLFESMDLRTSMCPLSDNYIFCYGNHPCTGITFLIDPFMRIIHLAPGYPCHGSGSIFYNNKVYTFGGFDGKNLVRAAYFDLSQNFWHQLSPMPKPSARCSCVIYGNMILLTGRQHSDAYLYDINTNSYSALGLTLLKDSTKIILTGNNSVYIIDAKGFIYKNEKGDINIWKPIKEAKLKDRWLNSYRVLYNSSVYFILDHKLYRFDLESETIKSVKKDVTALSERDIEISL